MLLLRNISTLIEENFSETKNIPTKLMAWHEQEQYLCLGTSQSIISIEIKNIVYKFL